MSKLNAQQLQAVNTIEGPVLIIAGPGTGKTTVLTHRIANILQKTDIKPEAILALTYTNSGVISMKQKLFSLIGQTAYRVNIFTIHSFCNNLIEEYPEHFPEVADGQQIAELDIYQIIAEILDNTDLSELKTLSSPYHYLKDIVSTIALLKREYITPEIFKEYINKQIELLHTIPKFSKRSRSGLTSKYSQQKHLIDKLQDLLKVYQLYQQKLQTDNLYDFEDMINFVLAKLKEDESFKRLLQERFLYFLIDEFQDSNSAQNQIIYELAEYWGEDANVFAVGDDDQSIYRFQGANAANMYDFINKYKNAQIIILKQNYRSTQNILDASFHLIQNNKLNLRNLLNLDKQLQSNVDYENARIKVAEFSSNILENMFIAEKIKELHKKGIDYSQIAILTRTNNNMDSIIEMLQRYKIPYIRKGGENVLNNPYINQLIALIRVIAQLDDKPDDDKMLFDVMHYDFLHLDSLVLLKLARELSNINKKRSVEEKRLNLWDYVYNKSSGYNDLYQLLDIEQSNITDKGFKQIVSFFEKLAEWYTISKNETFARFFEIIIKDSGFLDYILSVPGKFEHLNALNSFFEDIKALNRNNPDMQIKEFLKYLDLINQFNIKLAVRSFLIDKGGVQILTAHSAKGLEFDYVFIPQLYQRNWEKRMSTNKIKLPDLITNPDKLFADTQPSDQKLEEERRLLYVAITRAKRDVYLTYAQKYQDSLGHDREVSPSQFVTEIPQKYIIKLDTSKYEKLFVDNIAKLFINSKYKSVYISTAQDKDYVKSILARYRLSATDLNTFLEDPDLFYLKAILKTPFLETTSLVFGTAFHRAVKELYYHYTKDNQNMLDFESFFRIFEKQVNKAILTKEDKLKLLKVGKRILKAYYYHKSQNWFNLPKPVALEKKITKVVVGGVPLIGIIDKAVPISERSKDLVLVDYKTGNPINFVNADIRYVKPMSKSKNQYPDNKATSAKYKRQLLFYKILADNFIEFNIAGFKATHGELEFISKKDGSVKNIRMVYNPVEVEDMKQLIYEVWDRINNFKFNADD